MINLNFKNEFDEEEEKRKSLNVHKKGANYSSTLYLTPPTGIQMNIMKLKKYKTETQKVSDSKFKPGISNYIFPNFVITKRNKYVEHIINADNLLKKKMSYDNIFRHLIHYERLKKILFTEEQNKLFNNLPKIKIGELIEEPLLDKNELTQKVNSIDMNRQDKINRNLLKIINGE